MREMKRWSKALSKLIFSFAEENPRRIGEWWHDYHSKVLYARLDLQIVSKPMIWLDLYESRKWQTKFKHTKTCDLNSLPKKQREKVIRAILGGSELHSEDFEEVEEHMWIIS